MKSKTTATTGKHAASGATAPMPRLSSSQFRALGAALAGAYRPWRQQLRQRLGPRAPGVYRRLTRDRKKELDLLSVVGGMMRQRVRLTARSIIPVLKLVRRKEYSISNFYVELTCLEAAIRAVLDHSPDVTDATRTAVAAWVDAYCDNLLLAILDQTSAVYEKVAESGERAYCEIDRKGVITYANETMDRMLRGSSEGHRLTDFLQQDAALVSKSLKGDPGALLTTKILQMTRTDGSQVSVCAELAPISPGHKSTGAYACFTDISPITESQARVFDESPLGIIRTNENLEFTYANPSALEIFGTKEFRKRSVFELVPDRRNQSILKRKFNRRRRGFSDEYDLQITRQDDGRKVPVRIAAAAERSYDGRLTGSFAIIRNLELEQAVDAFHRYIETCRDSRELFKYVALATREVIPFDLFTISFYSRDLRHARVVFDYSVEGAIDWDTRWYTLAPWMIEWLETPVPVEDLDAFLSRPGAETIRNEPSVRRILKRGIRSFITYPVYLEDRVVAAVTLLSKRSKAFSDVAARLRALPFDKCVYMARYLDDKKEKDFRLKLINTVATSNSPDEVADSIVTALAEHYQWQHVALFRIDEAKGRFELRAQKAGPKNGYKLPDAYTQGLDQGIAGYSYRNHEPVNVANVKEDDRFREIYVPCNKRTNSELCIPLDVGGRISWLLNVEDQAVNAFSADEADALREIVGEVSLFLENMFVFYMFRELIDNSSDAVLILDGAANVSFANPAAETLLAIEQARLARGEIFPFSALFEEPALAASMMKQPKIPRTAVDLRDREGGQLKVMLSGIELPPEFGATVIFAQDWSFVERVKELETIQRVFSEVASHTRTPLSLLFSWLRRLEQETDPERLKDTVEKALRQLRKVELTYDRLVMFEKERGVIPFNPVLLNVAHLIRDSVEELPLQDQDKISQEIPADLPNVRGDLFQLKFVLQTILSCLLRYAAVDDTIPVEVRQRNGALEIRVTGPVADAGAEGVEDRRAATVEVDLALGEPIIESFMQSNNGRYERRTVGPDRVSFRLDLPTIAAGDRQ